MTQIIFYISAAISIIATLLAVTRHNAMHALLYLIVSLMAVAVLFYLIGAPFIAALEVMVYAGAIMTLFIFVIMMLNLGTATEHQEKEWLSPGTWIAPSILTAILLVQFLFVAFSAGSEVNIAETIEPREVGISLFTKYLLAVELSGMLLLSAIVGAFHLGKSEKKFTHRFLN